MSERVFADEFHKVFFERGIFLRLSRNERKTLIGKRLKAASCVLSDCRWTPCFVYAGGKIAEARKGVCI